jgi:ABC-2 type transport system ATP-binding protein
MSQPMLQFESVQKYYKSFLALDIPSLNIAEGLWWVQGVNGSGKTTFMKMVAGMIPFGGSIVYKEKLTIKQQRVKYLTAVSYAEAEPLYPPFLTGADLVQLFCMTKRVSVTETYSFLSQLNLTDALKNTVGGYSSGMVKKLSIALAFAGNPSLILLDEPFITIDVDAVETLRQVIANKHKTGISFIISSHQTAETDQIAFTGRLIANDRTIIQARI